jgi:hypothetical protein
MTLRKLVIAAALAAVAIPTVGYASWSTQAGQSQKKRAELYAIEKIEKIWHRATSKKNLDLMMCFWAPKSTMTSAGKTYTGKQTIRGVLAKAGPFQPQNHWMSETPAYKMRVTVNGNKGTLYFECHYVDVDTEKLTLAAGVDLEVRRIKGKWLVTHFSASSVDRPLRP